MSSTRCRVLAALSDMEWRSTKRVAELSGISSELAIHHLKALEEEGMALSRGTERRREWCWEPGGYPELRLDSTAAVCSYGPPF